MQAAFGCCIYMHPTPIYTCVQDGLDNATCTGGVDDCGQQ